MNNQQPDCPVWAVIPCRGLAVGKRRLAESLSPKQRETLNSELLVQVISAALACPSVHRTVVVSPDPDALELARTNGVDGLRELDGPNLNQALAQVANNAGHAAMLVLPADLPWLTMHDIDALLDNANGESQCIIVSDRHGSGTNALYILPATAVPFCFGTDSFERHAAAAKQRRVPVLHYQNDAIAFDIDLPEDLVRYRVDDTAQSVGTG